MKYYKKKKTSAVKKLLICIMLREAHSIVTTILITCVRFNGMNDLSRKAVMKRFFAVTNHRLRTAFFHLQFYWFLEKRRQSCEFAFCRVLFQHFDSRF